MRRSMIIWLSIGLGLVILGALLFVGAMMFGKWNFSNLDDEKYETNEYVITEEFENINVVVKTAKVEFKKSNDNTAKVVCYEYQKSKHDTAVQDKTLNICVNDTRKWYDHITIFDFGTPKITLYLPDKQYGDLGIKGSTSDITIKEDFTFENVSMKLSTGIVDFKSNVVGKLSIKTSTGDIDASDFSAGEVELSVTTGDIEVCSAECGGVFKVSVSTGDAEIERVNCASFVSTGDTGKLKMIDVIADKNFDIKRSTGDVRFEKCDAGEMFVKTDTGDVKGSLLSEKVFIYETDTGRVDLPKTTAGGKCEITTDTGDIIISIKE